MNPERWKQVESLDGAALERDVAQRAQFIEQACAGDDELRREVERLLSAHGHASQFLGSPALEVAARSVARDQEPPLVGSSFGHYRILSLLGAGGMGEVYLAEDTHLRRRVAIKIVPSEYTRNRDRLLRFQQEARAAGMLNHPNIIFVFEIGQTEGSHFIATEFVEGQTLRQKMFDSRIPLGEVLDITVQVASALAASHEAGIIHRDIKPENIMVRPDGYVKVLDFGLAKLSEHKSPSLGPETSFVWVSTNPGVVMGTVSYMSPEQARGLEVDERTDIFSLGVVLYEMIAGRVPFDGKTPSDVLVSILEREPPPLARHSPIAPGELQRIVSRALAKELDRRYQSVRDLLTDLKRLKLEFEIEEKIKNESSPSPKNEYPDVATTEMIDPSAIAPFISTVPSQEKLEPVGGAVPLGSKFYIQRRTDQELRAALDRGDSIVLIKGARQVGKTSLLARGLQQARAAGAAVVMTDFQSLNAESLESVEKLLRTFAEMFAYELDLDSFPDQTWSQHLTPSVNFERYLRREVLGKRQSPVVWGLDEVDRLFACNFASEVFGLFRSWHNKRALDPSGPWERLTQVIAYATEAHLFITDLNQSPFNVGTRLQLDDFTIEQVADLNRRYGSPLRDEEELNRYFRLVGGHPYLVRRGLHEMTSRSVTLDALESQSDSDEGPFGDHLRRIIVSLSQDSNLCEAVRLALRKEPLPSAESFYRLRSAGLISGDSARDAAPRCQLYATYLKRMLT
ncbi:MAG TPA: serine/threonine-protein kinase, partial [Blastocatellia bacterium]